MSKDNKSSGMHPALAKLINSNSYRKRVKRFIHKVKTLKHVQNGTILTKIPKRAYLSANATDAERAQFRKADEFRVDMDTIHYFMQPMESGSDRRASAPKVEVVAE